MRSSEYCQKPLPSGSKTPDFEKLEQATQPPSQRLVAGRSSHQSDHVNLLNLPRRPVNPRRAPVVKEPQPRPTPTRANASPSPAPSHSSPDGSPEELPLAAYGHRQDKHGVWKDWYGREVYTNPLHPFYGDCLVRMGDLSKHAEVDHAEQYPSWKGNNLVVPACFQSLRAGEAGIFGGDEATPSKEGKGRATFEEIEGQNDARGIVGAEDVEEAGDDLEMALAANLGIRDGKNIRGVSRAVGDLVTCESDGEGASEIERASDFEHGFKKTVGLDGADETSLDSDSEHSDDGTSSDDGPVIDLVNLVAKIDAVQKGIEEFVQRQATPKKTGGKKAGSKGVRIKEAKQEEAEPDKADGGPKCRGSGRGANRGGRGRGRGKARK